jgi:hypothetical protein
MAGDVGPAAVKTQYFDRLGSIRASIATSDCDSQAHGLCCMKHPTIHAHLADPRLSPHVPARIIAEDRLPTLAEGSVAASRDDDEAGQWGRLQPKTLRLLPEPRQRSEFVTHQPAAGGQISGDQVQGAFRCGLRFARFIISALLVCCSRVA